MGIGGWVAALRSQRRRLAKNDGLRHCEARPRQSRGLSKWQVQLNLDDMLHRFEVSPVQHAQAT
jgi:hypothetical protein